MKIGDIVKITEFDEPIPILNMYRIVGFSEDNKVFIIPIRLTSVLERTPQTIRSISVRKIQKIIKPEN